MRRQKKSPENLEKGMITIEVSVIVPIIFLLTVSIVFMMMFFLDMSIVKSEVMLIANETADVWKTDGDLATDNFEAETLLSRKMTFLMKEQRKELVKRAESRLSNRINEKLSVTKLRQYHMTMSLDKVNVTTEIQFNWPLSEVGAYIGSKGLSFTCNVKVPLGNWEEWLRAVDYVKE